MCRTSLVFPQVRHVSTLEWNWTHLGFSPQLDLELSFFVDYFLCALKETHTSANVEIASSILHAFLQSLASDAYRPDSCQVNSTKQKCLRPAPRHFCTQTSTTLIRFSIGQRSSVLGDVKRSPPKMSWCEDLMLWTFCIMKNTLALLDNLSNVHDQCVFCTPTRLLCSVTVTVTVMHTYKALMFEWVWDYNNMCLVIGFAMQMLMRVAHKGLTWNLRFAVKQIWPHLKGHHRTQTDQWFWANAAALAHACSGYCFHLLLHPPDLLLAICVYRKCLVRQLVTYIGRFANADLNKTQCLSLFDAVAGLVAMHQREGTLKSSHKIANLSMLHVAASQGAAYAAHDCNWFQLTLMAWSVLNLQVLHTQPILAWAACTQCTDRHTGFLCIKCKLPRHTGLTARQNTGHTDRQSHKQTQTGGWLSLSGRGWGIPLVGVILLTHVLVIISGILFILPVLCSLVPLNHIHLQKEYFDLVVIGLLYMA